MQNSDAEMIIGWLSLLSFLVAAMAACLFLLTRQVGLLVAERGILAARDDGEGPRIGEDLSKVIGDVFSESSSSYVLIFVSTGCLACANIVAAVEKLRPFWNTAHFVIFVDEDIYKRPIDERIDVRYNSAETRRNLGIGYVPFGIGISKSGFVTAKGLVNHVGHVESLLETVEEKMKI